MLTDIDMLMAGFVGGAISAFAIAVVMFNQIKFAFGERVSTLEMQLLALRVELDSSYSND